MSQTVRISDELHQAIDEYRSKDESYQDVIEQMAEEFGLLPSRIRDAAHLQMKLESTYSYEPEEVTDVLQALRFIYTGQEQPTSIGVPHEAANELYQDEIAALQRLGLVHESHHSGKYEYGYRTTAIGSEIGSELVRQLIDENSAELEKLLDSYDEAFLGVILRFGFSKTESGHLSDRSAALAGRHQPPLWDIQELVSEYRTFVRELKDIGLAVHYGNELSPTVLPPEFADFIRQRVDPGRESPLSYIEIYQTLLAYAEGELETQSDILHNLDLASEEGFARVIQEFYDKGLTSEYQSNHETPLLIKDTDGLEEQIAEKIKSHLGIIAEN
jgi:hypothetical protein